MYQLQAIIRIRAGTVLMMAVMLLIGACAGNGDGLDAGGQPLTPGGIGGGPLTAEFASIQANIFTPICSVCHSGADAPQGLRLDAANSYNLLVGVPSSEVPATLRVQPGAPGNSYLVEKLEGHAAVGAQMPLGGPYLSAATIAMIVQWITDGAQRPAPASIPRSFAVVTSVPAAADVLHESPPQIMVAFNGALDVTRLDGSSVLVERIMTNETEPRVERIPARISVPYEDSRVLLVWPQRALPNGRYRIELSTSPADQPADIAGRTLAGADAGSAVIATFEVLR